MVAASSSRKPKTGKPAAKKRTIVAKKKPRAVARVPPGSPAPAREPLPFRLVRIVARKRLGGRPTSNRFVLVCALEGDRIVDGEWFGKQVYPEDEGGEFAIIVREGCEIRYPAGFWRTNIGQRRIAVGELFTVFGEDDDWSSNDGDDVWEITHVTTLAAT